MSQTRNILLYIGYARPNCNWVVFVTETSKNTPDKVAIQISLATFYLLGNIQCEADNSPLKQIGTNTDWNSSLEFWLAIFKYNYVTLKHNNQKHLFMILQMINGVILVCTII